MGVKLIFHTEWRNMLRMFENRVLSKQFGSKRAGLTGDWNNFHNRELHDLYLPNIQLVK
jgi:hypothetical protein